jgi:hypothetical protein
MPSTRVLRVALGAIAAMVVVAFVVGRLQPQPAKLQPDELAAETYSLATSPADLPRSVRVALARQLGQGQLHIAAAGRPYNASDVVVDSALPYHRLVCAAVGSKYVVVQVEEGGLSPQLSTIVFLRGFWRSYTVWSGRGPLIREPNDFLVAIKRGTFWAESSQRPASWVPCRRTTRCS